MEVADLFGNKRTSIYNSVVMRWPLSGERSNHGARVETHINCERSQQVYETQQRQVRCF